MPLHLVKLAVGIEDIDQLRRVRAARTLERGGSFVYTRNRPRRAEDVLDGGSIYWVIRGRVQVRQLVTGLRSERDASGRNYCLIEVDPVLVPTWPRAFRPFQGWRYLLPQDAPPDRAGGDTPEAGSGEEPPEAMIAELRALGLI